MRRTLARPRLLPHRVRELRRPQQVAERGWVDVRSEDVNDYLKDRAGASVSAKDFRTWNGTVLAAVALARRADRPSSKTGRRRAVAAAVREVAVFLGNTPAVARRS